MYANVSQGSSEIDASSVELQRPALAYLPTAERCAVAEDSALDSTFVNVSQDSLVNDASSVDHQIFQVFQSVSDSQE